MRLAQRLSRRLKRHRDRRELYGKPCYLVTYPYWMVHDRLGWGPLGKYIALSRRIPSWTRGEEAIALVQCSDALSGSPLIVEIGSFLGCSTVLLAGARRLRGAGRVHCVDPFDASGESFSAPIYHAIRQSLGCSLREQFDRNIRGAGLTDWIEVHQGRAVEAAIGWTRPIDLLFLDGDQSYEGVQLAYRSWSPFLKPDGFIAVHNSRSGTYAAGHDGHRRLVEETVRSPWYAEVHCVGTTTFARKLSDDE